MKKIYEEPSVSALVLKTADIIAVSMEDIEIGEETLPGTDLE